MSCTCSIGRVVVRVAGDEGCTRHVVSRERWTLCTWRVLRLWTDVCAVPHGTDFVAVAEASTSRYRWWLHCCCSSHWRSSTRWGRRGGTSARLATRLQLERCPRQPQTHPYVPSASHRACPVELAVCLCGSVRVCACCERGMMGWSVCCMVSGVV